MLNLYYLIWVDCIQRAKKQSINKENWQTITMIFMTLPMSANFVLLMTILEKKVIHEYFYKIDFSFLSIRINNLLSYLFLFILPCFLINYLLIFRKGRYKNLLVKYRYYGGKIFLAYFLISMLVPIILLWVGIIFYK